MSRTNPTDAYRGQSGNAYCNRHFDPRMQRGRQLQADYFRPWCRDDRTLLDFGCGDGTLANELPARRKLGIEVNPACHQLVQQLNRHADVPIELHESLDNVPDNSIDVVISNHCLEHVDSPLQALRNLHRVLVPGGDIAIIVPFDDWRAPHNHTWDENRDDQHLYTWSPRNLGNLLVAADFRLHTVNLHSRAWSPRLFWVEHWFGQTAANIAWRMLAILRHRREVAAHANKPDDA